MRVLDLFSGIGGFSLGLESAGMQTAAFCEYDQHARKVLEKHWPDVPIFHDIRDLNAEVLYDNGIQDIGLICGGYPCQPFSLAGQRRGTEDNRHLWPEMFRLVQELRPTWVIGENVVGHITMGLDQVLTDLEGAGYATRPFVIPACAVDAQHRRDRVWVIAHANRNSESELSINEGKRRRQLVEDSICGSGRDSESPARRQNEETKRPQNPNPIAGSGEDVAYADSSQRQRNGSPLGIQSKYSESGSSSWWQPEPSVGRVADGVPNRSHRLRQLGNAVVPQVVEAIGRMIMSVEEDK